MRTRIRPAVHLLNVQSRRVVKGGADGEGAVSAFRAWLVCPRTSPAHMRTRIEMDYSTVRGRDVPGHRGGLMPGKFLHIFFTVLYFIF